MSRVARLFRSAKQIYHTDGPIGLLRRGYAFVFYRLFQYRTYYLYADPVEYGAPLNEAEFKPNIDNLMARIVSSNEEADELEAQGFDFRSYVSGARRRLDEGALANCIFVGNALAHFGWIALDQQALDSLDEPPYRVDFANKEAVGTGVWTNPKYRRKGFQKYAGFMFHKVLRENGIVVRWTAIRRNNIPAVKSRVTLHDPCAEGRYLRILWWKSWKEKPLSTWGQEAIRKTNEPRG